MKQLKVKGQQVIIRKAIKSDAKALVDYLGAIGAESDFLTFGKEGLDITVGQEEEFIESNAKKDNTLFIVAEINDKVIGNLSFSGGTRPRIRHVGELGVSVLKEYWGNGIGEELIIQLLKWAKATGIIKKINLRVRIDNIRGIYLYKKLGFVEEGIQKRDFYINGQYYDSLLMGVLVD